MSLSKKHFEAIAKIRERRYRLLPSVNHFPDDPSFCAGQLHELEEVVSELCEYFSYENPNFDRCRFTAACFPLEVR